ncbi:hypothetical protein ACOMHN_045478 [Nucella lapillus]
MSIDILKGTSSKIVSLQMSFSFSKVFRDSGTSPEELPPQTGASSEEWFKQTRTSTKKLLSLTGDFRFNAKYLKHEPPSFKTECRCC